MLDKLRGLLPISDRSSSHSPADDVSEIVAHQLRQGSWIDEVLAPDPAADRRTRGAATTEVTAALRDRDLAELRAAGLRVSAMLEHWSRRHGTERVFLWDTAAADVLTALARRKLGWSIDEVEVLWAQLSRRVEDPAWQMSIPPILRLPLAAAEELDPADRVPLVPLIEGLVGRLDVPGPGVFLENEERRRFVRRLRELLPTAAGDALVLGPAVLGDGDGFGPDVRGELEATFDPGIVVPLLNHLAGYTGGVTPGRRWRERLAALLAEEPPRAEAARLLLERACDHKDSLRHIRRHGHVWEEQVFVTDDTAQLLRAAVWAVRGTDASWAAPLLGRAAVHCGGGLGGAAGTPRCSQVASSAIAALGELDGEVTVAQLSWCQSRLRNKTLRKSLERTLQAVAARAGLTPGQLLERAVPTLGLDAGGRTERTVGEHTAQLVLDAGAMGLSWRSPTGRAVKTTPKAVREEHAETLAELRATVKEAKKLLASERARLESLLAADRTWTGADWVRYYLDHPVTGAHARGLLWQVAADGRWVTGLPTGAGEGWALRGADGTTVPVAAEAQLRLWHPIQVDADEVATWREELSSRELRQPFKQAFREVYLLTPAEEATDTYSNRFAAHILRYRQAGALMRARGWSGNHLGYWDGGYQGETTREVGEDGWRAKFYYDLVENAEADGYGTPGLCSTDQVRFEHLDHTGAHARWREARMADVPPLVFSEAMRDVDLFVGVTSIAADPEWVDAGHDRHRDYWYRTSFGDLTESAQVRREALTRLMPRTKIADRVRVTAKFLEVDGSLHTYKIHLGSGNILMSPNDAYLCIVTGRGNGAGRKLFLPFEEDGGLLSVIVSKAFLLADDTAITDPTITHQLRTR